MGAVIIINTVKMFTSFLDFIILIRILSSWLPDEYKNNILIRLVYDFTEPIISPIRSLINKSPFGELGMMIDFSPIIASLCISFLAQIIIRIVQSF